MPVMLDGFVKIAVFSDYLLANLAKSKLEAEDIPTFIANENTIRMDFFYAQALGGVQIWVPREDAERALAALAGDEVADSSPSSETVIPTLSSKDETACPACGSTDVSKRRRLTKAGIVSFFLGLPLPFFRRQNHCYQCHRTWGKGSSGDVKTP